MSERCYYKVENKESDLFKRTSEFLAKEDRLQNFQKKSIIAKVPKFDEYQGERGFNRIIRFTGFVFDNPQNVDPKVWKTKKEGGKIFFVPYLRTKAGREMDKFLNSFETTTVWDVDALLKIDNKIICGEFYPANLFKYNDCVYILLDTKYREIFEKNNSDFIEITYGEIKDAIDCRNRLVLQESKTTNN